MHLIEIPRIVNFTSMKKIWIILVISFGLFLHKAEAQSETRFGIRLSPAFTWLTTDNGNIGNNGTNLGFNMAIKADMFFSEKAALSYGIGLGLNQGGRLLYDNPGNYFPNSELTSDLLLALPANTDIRYKVNYIQVPVSLKILTDEILQLRDVRFTVDAPMFTLGFRNKAFADVTGLSGLPGYDENFYKEIVTKDVNPFDFSWGFGLGMEYSLSGSSKEGTSLILGLAYSQSILDITKNDGTFVKDGVTEEEDSHGTRHGINIVIGMAF